MVGPCNVTGEAAKFSVAYRSRAAHALSLGVSFARPVYFPVKPEPLRLQPGLFRFGTDFGNGEADQRFFPRDASTPRYLAEKARVLAAFPERDAHVIGSEAEQRSVDAAHGWLARTLAAEGLSRAASAPLAELGRELVEDFAILQRDASGADRVLYLHACFPSGWRPEQVLGRSFQQIHQRIPTIASVLAKSRSLVDAMIERGPYLRFVWTIAADDELDHHPEQGRRAPWSPAPTRAFLRVERQTTVPLPEADASVFLIRTYLYGFEQLSPEQRADLRRALELMPPELRQYKRLEDALPRALELLSAAGR
jgi:hypothetical protein